MAGVKYIKKTEATGDESPAVGRRGRSAVAEPKTQANTKAKVTKAPATKAAAKDTEDDAPKKRGRPKATETATAKGTKATKAATTTKAKTATKKAADTKTNGDAPKKRAVKPKAATPVVEDKPKATRKRKAEDSPEAAPAKKAKVIPKGPVINDKPTQRLNVYVFGEGSSGELGLGTAKNAIDVKRPRLNANLAADAVGVVQVATGGMHVVALTHDNKIVTWGVNDQGALGRDTTWEGGLKDMDAAGKEDEDSDDDDDDDSGLNPNESTPAAIPTDSFTADTVFVQVAASDSASFAVTDDGQVWGWGTFRGNEGLLGFTDKVEISRQPMLLANLKKIKKIACGANHVLALDANGSVVAWGAGEQNQLGRRIIERSKLQGLVPREFGLPRKAIKDIACGSYHSFAIDNKDRVFGWGLNNFGETGVTEGIGEDDAAILKPTVVDALSGQGVVSIEGGSHHSIAALANGDCVTWGRIDGNQIGIPLSALPEENTMKDAEGRVRIVQIPTKVDAIPDAVAYVTAGPEHNIAITAKGKAYAWGFSANYQTALGTEDDVLVPTLIDNTAVKEKKLLKAFAGGQFGILTCAAEQTNGVNGSAA